MWPSEVRARILESQRQLRLELDAIQALATRVEQRLEEPAALCGRGRGFVAALGAHLDLEEKLLVPVLADIDAWGAERVRQLTSAHRGHRALMSRARALFIDDQGERAQCVADVRAFITGVEEGLAWERTHALDERLLNEEVVQVDLGG